MSTFRLTVTTISRAKMAFTKLVVFSTLLYIVNSANPDKGYLWINGSVTKGCHDLPNNTQCPSNLVNYKVFGSGIQDTFANAGLKSVDLFMMSLKFFKEVTQTCEDAVREYACSNTFAKCVKDENHLFGLAVTFNVSRTKQACARVMRSCPLSVQMAVANNCTTIMTNFMDYVHCVDISDIPGDACPKSNLKHPKANVNFYPTFMRQFNQSFTMLAPIMSPGCRRKFRDINCELLRGPICSTNMHFRIYTTTQQQCVKTMKHCLPSFVPNLQPYVEMCELLPDGNKAKMIALPSNVTMSNNSL